ncbi:VOC family protein [Deinococcus apachensis]|uniref:VOC family protein n=1 Tax=Deinococcus apachensis TaxID=309886 RepID=UPI00036ACDEA|nr:VOC family protein [Deinococcus apachensis]
MPTSLQPLFRKVDCLQLPVPGLEAGLGFYQGGLGHELLWQTAAAGLRMPETDTELVLQTQRPEPEVDLLFVSADAAADSIRQVGGQVVEPPFDVQVGRCAVLLDPWGTPWWCWT